MGSAGSSWTVAGIRPGQLGMTPLASAPWSTLLPAAKTAMRAGVKAWAAKAALDGGKVNGPCAIAAPGCLSGPSFEASLKAALVKARVRRDVAGEISAIVWDAFKAWADNVIVPGLPWYPAFADWPGSSAPPTPNASTPLCTMPSARIAEMIKLGLTLIDTLRPAVVNETGAKEFLADYGTWIYVSFRKWQLSARWTQVLGEGPVPSYAPPAVKSGPVVGGSFSGGRIAGTFG